VAVTVPEVVETAEIEPQMGTFGPTAGSKAEPTFSASFTALNSPWGGHPAEPA